MLSILEIEHGKTPFALVYFLVRSDGTIRGKKRTKYIILLRDVNNDIKCAGPSYHYGNHLGDCKYETKLFRMPMNLNGEYSCVRHQRFLIPLLKEYDDKVIYNENDLFIEYFNNDVNKDVVIL